MANSKPLPIEPESIDVDIPAALRGGVYSNTLNIAATNSEITLNFIYVNPTDSPKGTLVSRVIVPPAFADKLASMLKQVSKQITEEIKKQEDKQL